MVGATLLTSSAKMDNYEIFGVFYPFLAKPGERDGNPDLVIGIL